MNKLIKNAQGNWVEAPMSIVDVLNPLVPAADDVGALAKLLLGVLLGKILSD